MIKNYDSKIRCLVNLLSIDDFSLLRGDVFYGWSLRWINCVLSCHFSMISLPVKNGWAQMYQWTKHCYISFKLAYKELSSSTWRIMNSCFTCFYYFTICRRFGAINNPGRFVATKGGPGTNKFNICLRSWPPNFSGESCTKNGLAFRLCIFKFWTFKTFPKG